MSRVRFTCFLKNNFNLVNTSKIREKIRVNSYFCEFTHIFARILLVFLFKKGSYFARIFKKMSSYEELDTLLMQVVQISEPTVN